MFVELTPEQCNLLARVVDEALDEIGPEIRHTFKRDYRDGLKEQRRELRSLYDLLATTGLRTTPAAGVASSEALEPT